MPPGPEILTVGHSNHEEAEFVALLQRAGVEVLVDVRANPHSRYPQFNRSALAGSLEASGIHYVSLADQLGGRRLPRPGSPNDGWEVEAFRGYADHMATDLFIDGVDRVLDFAATRRVAVMCAEADWERCHRRLLADALLARGARVLHLGPDGELAEHVLTEFAIQDGDVLIYPETQTSLDV